MHALRLTSLILISALLVPVPIYLPVASYHCHLHLAENLFLNFAIFWSTLITIVLLTSFMFHHAISNPKCPRWFPSIAAFSWVDISVQNIQTALCGRVVFLKRDRRYSLGRVWGQARFWECVGLGRTTSWWVLRISEGFRRARCWFGGWWCRFLLPTFQSRCFIAFRHASSNPFSSRWSIFWIRRELKFIWSGIHFKGHFRG